MVHELKTGYVIWGGHLVSISRLFISCTDKTPGWDMWKLSRWSLTYNYICLPAQVKKMSFSFHGHHSGLKWQCDGERRSKIVGLCFKLETSLSHLGVYHLWRAITDVRLFHIFNRLYFAVSWQLQNTLGGTFSQRGVWLPHWSVLSRQSLSYMCLGLGDICGCQEAHPQVLFPLF